MGVLREKSEGEDTLMVGKIGDGKKFFRASAKMVLFARKKEIGGSKKKIKKQNFFLSSTKGFKVSNTFIRKR